MLVLVINSGSSSLKYQVRDVEAGSVLTEGLVEKIGMGAGGEGDGQIEGPRDHAEALEQVDADIHAALGDRVLDAVGHRVVHGGERFAEPVLVNNEITRAIERLNPLAPLHNPANVLGIRAISKKWPELPQVAVFDTAFHRTLPEHAWRYAVPDELYTNHGIRRYGFHGTSHEYVAHRAAALLDVPVEEFDAVIAHLGNGASVTAIRGGQSIDTSMGFTPARGPRHGHPLRRPRPVHPGLPRPGRLVPGGPRFDAEPAVRAQGPGRKQRHALGGGGRGSRRCQGGHGPGRRVLPAREVHRRVPRGRRRREGPRVHGRDRRELAPVPRTSWRSGSVPSASSSTPA